MASETSSTAWSLQGHRAAVIGSTSGIGRATALEIAARKGDVIIHGRRSIKAAEAVAEECRVRGAGRVAVLMADLADRAAGDRLVDQALEVFGGLDSWLQIAGADTLTGEGALLSFEEKLDLLWEVDVVATMRLCRRVGQFMKQRGHGLILTMGWDQAETGMEGDSGELFGATKGAIMAFTKSLALSLAPEVRVNGLAPGWIKTAWGENAPESWQTRAISEAPLQRWGTPDDVAQVVRFLIEPGASFLTGQIIRINGGAIR